VVVLRQQANLQTVFTPLARETFTKAALADQVTLIFVVD
jgi:hypothetical protein